MFNNLCWYRVPSLAQGSYKQCTVLFEYDAQADDELSIRVGEPVKVYQVSEDGWVEVGLELLYYEGVTSIAGYFNKCLYDEWRTLKLAPLKTCYAQALES